MYKVLDVFYWIYLHCTFEHHSFFDATFFLRLLNQRNKVRGLPQSSIKKCPVCRVLSNKSKKQYFIF